MKNISLSAFQVIDLRVIAVTLMIGFSACSDDNENGEEEMEPVEDPVDLSVVEGRYVGTWDWEFGAGPISMELSDLGNGRYSVKFYETRTFNPAFNTDGVTPEALGILEIDGENATIDLDLNTDRPPCVGEYTGEGTRSDQGRFVLEMDIRHDCAIDAPATFTLDKVG